MKSITGSATVFLIALLVACADDNDKGSPSAVVAGSGGTGGVVGSSGSGGTASSGAAGSAEGGAGTGGSPVSAGNAGNDSVPAREMADPISDGASDSLLGRAETTPAIHAFPAEGETPPRWPVCPICAETDRPAGSAAGCRTCRQFLTAIRQLPPDPRDGPAPGHPEDPRWL